MIRARISTRDIQPNESFQWNESLTSTLMRVLLVVPVCSSVFEKIVRTSHVHKHNIRFLLPCPCISHKLFEPHHQCCQQFSCCCFEEVEEVNRSLKSDDPLNQPYRYLHPHQFRVLSLIFLACLHFEAQILYFAEILSYFLLHSPADDANESVPVFEREARVKCSSQSIVHS